MEATDGVVLGAIARQVLQPDVVEEIIARTVAARAVEQPRASADDLRTQLARIDGEIDRCVGAIAHGGDVPELVAAVKARRAQRADLARRLADVTAPKSSTSGAELATEIHQRLSSWRDLMGRHVAQARQILRKMLLRPILFEPAEVDGEIGFRFRGEASIAALLSGVDGLPLMVVLKRIRTRRKSTVHQDVCRMSEAA